MRLPYLDMNEGLGLSLSSGTQLHSLQGFGRSDPQTLTGSSGNEGLASSLLTVRPVQAHRYSRAISPLNGSQSPKTCSPRLFFPTWLAGPDMHTDGPSGAAGCLARQPVHTRQTGPSSPRWARMSFTRTRWLFSDETLGYVLNFQL